MNKNIAYISYAWGDDTPTGKAREAIVDDLCRSFADVGIAIGRDKNEIKAGDSIEAYGRRIAKADIILAVISHQSLRSDYCMLYELYEAYVRRGGHFGEFGEDVVALVLEDAEEDLRNKISLISFWKARCQALEAEVSAADPEAAESLESRRVLMKCKNMIMSLPDMLLNINQIAMPRGVADIRRDNFGAVRKCILDKLQGSSTPSSLETKTLKPVHHIHDNRKIGNYFEHNATIHGSIISNSSAE
jgi:internalin A